MMRVAVVGAGQMARRVYLPALAAMEDVQLAVLVEPQADRRDAVNEKYRFARAVESASDIDPNEADCALLLTHHDHRREQLTALLEMGLDVLSEKPMAANLAEAEEFVALAAKHGRTFMVSFNRRFMPAYLKAKEFIADRPILICRAWKHRGMLWAHSIHVIDVLRWFCGEPVAIQADGNFDDEGRETAAAGLVRFDSGAIALFETCASYGRRQEEFVAHGKKFTVEVLSPYKTVMAEDDTGSQTVYRHGSNAWYCQAQEQYGFVGQIRHFLDAVANGSVPTSVASEAIKSHRLAHDLLAAARQRGERG